MSPTMRRKLERNAEYHGAMAAFYTEQDKKKKEAEAKKAQPAPRSGTARSGSTSHPPTDEHPAAAAPPKPPQSSEEKLAEMHGDVAKQLSAVLAASRVSNAVNMVKNAPRPLRNGSPELKPSAGRFH